MSDNNKISVLLVQPNKYPKLIEIDDSLEAMQKIVGGNIERYMPFEDEITIICNKEGIMRGLPLNRVIYAEPQIIDMTYQDMKDCLREAKNSIKNNLLGYIVFTEDSFDKPYNEMSRTYVICFDDKEFQQSMVDYSIFGSCLGRTDYCSHLEGLMEAEGGGKNGWKIERCYVKKLGEIVDFIAGTFFIAHTPSDSEKFETLPNHLAEKYRKKFKYPERFFKTASGIKPVPFQPISKSEIEC